VSRLSGRGTRIGRQAIGLHHQRKQSVEGQRDVGDTASPMGALAASAGSLVMTMRALPSARSGPAM
jgi:hypothetical protein